MNNIEILDTTLRDGAQGEHISFSIHDKLRIVKLLDNLGVTYIEAGNPAANQREADFFKAVKEITLQHSQLVAFGSTALRGFAPTEDAGLRRLINAGTYNVCIFGKNSLTHVREVLRITSEENLKLIADSISYCVQNSKRVIYDAEHFFDGYLEDSAYALETLRAAKDAGAETLCLCDTNGSAHPSFVQEAVKKVAAAFPGVKIGIHCHNDRGCAVASSMLAFEAGACHIQGTLTGLGERCGNTCLSTLLPNLFFSHNIRTISGNMDTLTDCAATLNDIANRSLPNNLPYVGASAFAHKAGMHADGVSKLPGSFEHIDPALVGNRRRFLVSEMTGRSAIIQKLSELLPDITLSNEDASAIAEAVKEQERNGYHLEAAEASFELLVLKLLGRYTPHFILKMYRTTGEYPHTTGTTAMLQVEAFGEIEMAATVGNGPVNALDSALRRALSRFYPELARMRLTDYKVRVLPDGIATASLVRVHIDSTDGTHRWSTMGVSADIIEASYRALADSVEYYLLRHGKRVIIDETPVM